ncbi:hypothetical protein GALMADRAFT_255829, partial [Galerina marginata CBS 339.88]
MVLEADTSPDTCVDSSRARYWYYTSAFTPGNVVVRFTSDLYDVCGWMQDLD